MVMLTDCIPCHYGDHSGHHEVVQAVPEGMMGGARCVCTGDCAERNPQTPLMVVDAPPLDLHALDDLLGRTQPPTKET